MRNNTAKQWMKEMDNAWGSLVASSVPSANSEMYRLHSAPCPVHGMSCVTVVFADILQHVDWQITDPHDLAARLLGPGREGRDPSRRMGDPLPPGTEASRDHDA